MTPERFGFDMPVDSPLYSPLPHYFTDAEILQITYETDREAVLDLLPSALEVADSAVAVLTVFHFPAGTLGSYNEVALDLACTLRGQRKFFTAYNLVDNDAGMAAGREIWGVPKKQAHVTLSREFDLVMGTADRPMNNRLFTALVRPETPVEPSGFGAASRLCLRVMPNVEAGKPPSIAQLVDRDGHRVTPKRVWRGRGSLVFPAQSAIDPWHAIAVRRIVDATYGIYDYTLDYGTVVESYHT
jgi:acetoacetate decarboxylase